MPQGDALGRRYRMLDVDMVWDIPAQSHWLAGRTVRLAGGARFTIEDWWTIVRPDDRDLRHPTTPALAKYIARRVGALEAPVPGVYGHWDNDQGDILAPDELAGAVVPL